MLAVILAALGTALIGFALSYYVAQPPPAESTMRALNASFANTGYLGAGACAERSAAGPCALFAIGLFVSQLSIRAGVQTGWQTAGLKLVVHPLLMAVLASYVLPVNAFWARIAVVCPALPLGATAFVLAQRYRLLEAETSTGAVISTAASLVTVSLVMALLAGR